MVTGTATWNVEAKEKLRLTFEFGTRIRLPSTRISRILRALPFLRAVFDDNRGVAQLIIRHLIGKLCRVENSWEWSQAKLIDVCLRVWVWEGRESVGVECGDPLAEERRGTHAPVELFEKRFCFDPVFPSTGPSTLSSLPCSPQRSSFLLQTRPIN